MYVRLREAMYGALKSEILYYSKLSKKLRESGFVIDSYNPLVARKCTEGRQLIVVWHVGDMKVLHKNKE